jgi:two-component system cell cycle response regulator
VTARSLIVESARRPLSPQYLPADSKVVSYLQTVSPRRDTPTTVKVALSALGGLILLSLAHSALGLASAGSDTLFEDWVYDAVMMGCAAACLARAAVIGQGNGPWLILGLGMACDAGGEILSSIGESFAPGAQDALYILFYLAAYVAVVLLGRRRVTRFRASMWLDGIIGALAVGCLAATALDAPVLVATRTSVVKAGLDIAFPLTDVLLVGIVILMLALGGWRSGRPFAMLAFGFVVMAVADGIYLYQEAHGGYTAGTPLDCLWLLSALSLSYAAWQPDGAPPSERDSSILAMVAPVLFGATAIAVLVYGNATKITGLAIWLGVATLLVVLVRLVITANENVHLIASSTDLANHDALTGLGNRRALLHDLERALEQATPAQPRLLLLFDLNGFKHYNDTFGHPAGDALLKRLGSKLADSARPSGLTYRLGGDEFCTLLDGGDDPSSHAGTLAGALLEAGEHFTIGASYGEVLLGLETREVDEALRIADQRLYAQKTLVHRPASLEWRDVLVGLLRERDPQLGTDVQVVADLARRLGERLGVDAEDLRVLVAAAELHDIGKAAIPDAILQKPAALDREERAFIERHTLIGQRILAAAPTGRAVGAVVRATHEHYDGGGYPDGLHGKQIPLAARIIAVCDAYCAMGSDGSYREAMTQAETLRELQRCSGKQFDPGIVEVFLELMAVEGTVDGADLPSSTRYPKRTVTK